MLVDRGDWTAEEAARFTASLDGGAFSYRVDCVVAWGTK